MAISDIEAARLRAKWGERSCDHPDYEYERSTIGGAKTGDIVCVQCGKTWDRTSAEAQAVMKKATERRK